MDHEVPPFIDEHILVSLPKTVIYISNFITEEEESEILSNVYSAPKPKWTQLKNRRLQNWGGIPHPKGMIPEKIPNWLQKYLNKIDELHVFENGHSPNHVLINEYAAGQGIMPHVDGLLFFPVITTISCGSYTLLHFYPCKEIKSKNVSNHEARRKQMSLLLEPRSLLVLQHDVYTEYMHGIDETITDVLKDVNNLNYCDKKYKIGQHLQRTTRISLTIRNVPKCSNFKLIF